jgi:protein-L-isoaspartate(D-aspartate) O-methyltransferase
MRRSQRHGQLNRRELLVSAGGLLASGFAPSLARANVTMPYDWNTSPPSSTRAAYIDWMVKNRGENPKYLGIHYDRFAEMVSNKDLLSDRDKRAFLMTPREEFCLPQNLPHVYDVAFLDIGYGVTISGPNLVGRMTSTLTVQKGDKVLEVGTGSGYQSAFLSNLTDKVWTIEIIKPLADRTRGIYDGLIAKGYGEYSAITTKRDDGYYGWQENAPFDKIIVTCGIDHIPPPLLSQLQPNGIMVIPVGPPGAQHVLKVTKKDDGDGNVTVTRSDIYNGRIVPFVPFTSLQGDVIKGTHNQ